jgi:predicted phage-related endonuclease
VRVGESGFIEPGSAVHRTTFSPSKIAAILGISRFQSQYSCWMEMAGRVPESQEVSTPEVFKIGHAFEYALAHLWKEDNQGWRLSRQGVQITTDQYGFPAVCTLDRLASRGRARRVVEFKTARDLSEWGDEGGDEAPQDYLVQVQAQMLLTGLRSYPAHLMVMGPFFKRFNYVIEYDTQVTDWIIAKCQEFHRSLQDGNPPPLDDSTSTYNTVRAMHPDITDGKAVEVPESLWHQVSAANQQSKESDKQLRGLKAQLLDIVQDGQTATINGEVVAVRRPSSRGSVALILK